MTWRTPLFVICLIGGPFISIGAVTFYRRALAWWYEHEISMSADASDFVSWIVLIVIGISILFSIVFRIIEGHLWWEPKP